MTETFVPAYSDGLAPDFHRFPKDSEAHLGLFKEQKRICYSARSRSLSTVFSENSIAGHNRRHA